MCEILLNNHAYNVEQAPKPNLINNQNLMIRMQIKYVYKNAGRAYATFEAFIPFPFLDPVSIFSEITTQ